MTQHGPVPDFPVKDKIVAITGGGSGIGFAFASLCHQQGARVLIGDLKLVKDAEAYVSQSSNGSIIFEHCDVSSWPSLENLITASVKTFGSVPDVYVPCAGIFVPPWSNFWNDTEPEAYKTMQINVNHPIKFTRLALRALAGAEKQGVVCLVASAAGIRGNYLAALYAAAKHAVVGFAKSMGEADVEEGVKVVCVLPGMVRSPLWEDREDDYAERVKYLERESLGPEDVAELMVRMVEGKGYDGGTCVLKTAREERVVEHGHLTSRGQAKYDPSPRPEPDIGHIKHILAGERGKEWKVSGE